MKKIGVFMGDVTRDYQKDVLQAIFKEANKLGYTVFCFANFGAYGDKVLYAEGERGIVYLPDLTQLDGIIVGEDTFDVPGMENEIYEYLKKNAKCPVVYLRVAREEFYRVVMDEGEAIRNMIRHFTKFHKFRDICFMTGAFDRLDARRRYQGYLDVMREEGIEVTDHMVFFGDYWREKGREAVDWFLEGREPGNYPQAIICSNDYMALSVCEELQHRGIRIPEDICVSGYDDVTEGREYHPSLTTARVPFDEMGKRAVQIIEEVQHGQTPELATTFVPTLCFRQSCGCHEQALESHSWRRMHNKLDAATRIYNQSLFLNADYQEAFREEEYLKVTERYFGDLGCSKGYLCLCEEAEHGENTQLPGAFTENMVLRKIFIKGKLSQDYHEVFPRGILLPKLVNSAVQGRSLMVFPIHFKNRIFGYLVLVVGEAEWPTSFVQAYLMALALAMENSAAQKEIADLEQFRNLYRRDSLTGLYNRRGYEHYLRILYSKSKEENRHLSIVSIDMDGLKYINDNFGHAEGDAALSRLSVVLAELVQENEICARTGGDEFMVLLYYDKEGREEQFVKDLYTLLEEEQSRNPKPYPVHASVGCCCVSKSSDMSLAACAQLADSRMYENKKAYKESLKAK